MSPQSFVLPPFSWQQRCQLYLVLTFPSAADSLTPFNTAIPVSLKSPNCEHDIKPGMPEVISTQKTGRTWLSCRDCTHVCRAQKRHELSCWGGKQSCTLPACCSPVGATHVFSPISFPFCCYQIEEMGLCYGPFRLTDDVYHQNSFQNTAFRCWWFAFFSFLCICAEENAFLTSGKPLLLYDHFSISHSYAPLITQLSHFAVIILFYWFPQGAA